MSEVNSIIDAFLFLFAAISLAVLFTTLLHGYEWLMRAIKRHRSKGEMGEVIDLADKHKPMATRDIKSKLTSK